MEEARLEQSWKNSSALGRRTEVVLIFFARAVHEMKWMDGWTVH